MNDPTPLAAADQQVLITRFFDAPRERVFKAWIDRWRSGTAPSTRYAAQADPHRPARRRTLRAMPEVGMHEPTITRGEFIDHGAKTRMTLSDGPYAAGRDHAEAGWTAAIDDLAALVT